MVICNKYVIIPRLELTSVIVTAKPAVIFSENVQNMFIGQSAMFLAA